MCQKILLQTARFIELNTGAITKLKQVANCETVDQDKKDDFVSATKDILNIVITSTQLTKIVGLSMNGEPLTTSNSSKKHFTQLRNNDEKLVVCEYLEESFYDTKVIQHISHTTRSRTAI